MYIDPFQMPRLSGTDTSFFATKASVSPRKPGSDVLPVYPQATTINNK
jgi:hypothetical protein